MIPYILDNGSDDHHLPTLLPYTFHMTVTVLIKIDLRHPCITSRISLDTHLHRIMPVTLYSHLCP